MKIVNNTNQIKHLPYGGTLEPGENDLKKSQIKANQGHPGFEADLKEGRVEILELKEEKEAVVEQKEPEEFPQPLGGGWFLLSNGEKVQGEDEAYELEEELSGD